jgi:hypothetical protein
MPTITLEVPSPGQDITAGLHAANYSDLQALLNGGLDGSNINQSVIFALGGSGITLGSDVNLYRSAANVLATDDTLLVGKAAATAYTTGIEFNPLGLIYAVRSATGSDVFRASVNADTVPRFNIDSDGKHSWGPGNAAADTNLYRLGANILSTDDSFRIRRSGAVGTEVAFGVYGAAESFMRVQINNDGAFIFGDGTAGGDTNLYRNAASALKTDGQLEVVGALYGAWTGSVYGFSFSTTGQLSLPVQGAAGGLLLGLDVNLYRSAANTLKTDDGFIAAGAIRTDLYFGTSGTNTSAASYSAIVTGDAFNRLLIGADGKHSWGPGNVVGDTNLYRAAADVLKTDDAFKVGWNEGTAVDTGLFLTINGIEKRVLAGAADSGGAGYKMLRVLN